jgi:hypothetical protein
MQNSHSFVHFSYLLLDVSAGRTVRERRWTSQEFSLAGITIIIITATTLPKLTYHPGETIGPLVAEVLTPST